MDGTEPMLFVKKMKSNKTRPVFFSILPLYLQWPPLWKVSSESSIKTNTRLKINDLFKILGVPGARYQHWQDVSRLLRQIQDFVDASWSTSTWPSFHLVHQHLWWSQSRDRQHFSPFFQTFQLVLDSWFPRYWKKINQFDMASFFSTYNLLDFNSKLDRLSSSSSTGRADMVVKVVTAKKMMQRQNFILSELETK